MQRADSMEKTMMLGKIEGRRRRRGQKMNCLDGIINSMDMNLSKLWEMVNDRGAWYAAVHEVTKSWTQQQLNNKNIKKKIKSLREQCGNIGNNKKLFFLPEVTCFYYICV